MSVTFINRAPLAVSAFAPGRVGMRPGHPSQLFTPLSVRNMISCMQQKPLSSRFRS